MKEAKYRYTLTESNVTCCIDDVTRDNRHDHRYFCIGCGREMIANLGTKKISYFSHKEIGVCNGETYIHQLAKLKLKEKFDKSTSFNISYATYTACDNADCKFRRELCDESKEEKVVDLKQLYDICEIEKEVSINGRSYIGDLVLTNSQKPDRTPFLIEVFNTHESTNEKIHSGLKILEVEIHDENTLEKLLSNDIIIVDNENIFVHGFNLNFNKRLNNKIPRLYYIKGQNFSFKMIPCSQQSEILFDESDLEINVPPYACVYDYYENTEGVSAEYIGQIASYFSIKTCSLCEYYYQHKAGGHFYDGGSGRFHGIIIDGKMPEDIDSCYKLKSDYCFFHKEMINELEIVKNNIPKTSYYIVAVSASKQFYNNDFLVEKCKQLLKNKLETENVKLLVGIFSQGGGASGALSCFSLSEELGIPMEMRHADWEKHGKKAGPVLNNEIIAEANALIYFWNGDESDPRYLVKLAKDKGLPVRIVNYGKEENLCPICGATMLTRYGKRGYFKGCIRYPDCNGTRQVHSSDNTY